VAERRAVGKRKIVTIGEFAFLSVLEGSDRDLLADTFEQVPASTDDRSIR
jgi:hypothetical protein